jgi:hypothetical protein
MRCSISHMSRPRAAQEAYARAAARLQRQRSKTHALARGLSYPSLRDTAGLRVKDTMPAAAGAMQATVSLHDFGGISSGRPEPRSSRPRCHLRSEERSHQGQGKKSPVILLSHQGQGKRSPVILLSHQGQGKRSPVVLLSHQGQGSSCGSSGAALACLAGCHCLASSPPLAHIQERCSSLLPRTAAPCEKRANLDARGKISQSDPSDAKR